MRPWPIFAVRPAIAVRLVDAKPTPNFLFRNRNDCTTSSRAVESFPNTFLSLKLTHHRSNVQDIPQAWTDMMLSRGNRDWIPWPDASQLPLWATCSKRADASHGRNKSFTLFTSFEYKHLPPTNWPPVENFRIGFLILPIALDRPFWNPT